MAHQQSCPGERSERQESARGKAAGAGHQPSLTDGFAVPLGKAIGCFACQVGRGMFQAVELRELLRVFDSEVAAKVKDHGSLSARPTGTTTRGEHCGNATEGCTVRQ